MRACTTDSHIELGIGKGAIDVAIELGELRRDDFKLGVGHVFVYDAQRFYTPDDINSAKALGRRGADKYAEHDESSATVLPLHPKNHLAGAPSPDGGHQKVSLETIS